MAMDYERFSAFLDRMKSAESDFAIAMKTWFEGIGFEMLRIVQDEIIRKQVMDTRLLLASFQKGHTNNVWEITDGDLSVEVGSTVNYAKHVNDGHFTTKAGQESRFVPGRWDAGRFIYDPTAKGGMVLKKKWVEGKHYWESALRIMDKILPEYLDAKLKAWISTYFEDFLESG